MRKYTNNYLRRIVQAGKKSKMLRLPILVFLAAGVAVSTGCEAASRAYHSFAVKRVIAAMLAASMLLTLPMTDVFATQMPPPSANSEAASPTQDTIPTDADSTPVPPANSEVTPPANSEVTPPANSEVTPPASSSSVPQSCICAVFCTAANGAAKAVINTACPVCSANGADLALSCRGIPAYVLSAAAAASIAQINALPTIDELGAVDTDDAGFDAYLAQLREDVTAARAAYDALTNADKSAFDAAVIEKLAAIETTLSALPMMMPAPKATNAIDISVSTSADGTSPVTGGGASLLAAVAASGTALSSITSLTVTNGKITETDWIWFMGGDTPILTTLTHFTVADAVTSVANIPNGSSESPVFPKTIKNVSIPQAITIGEYAFYYCMALTSASFPAATSIGEEAFNGCNKLATLKLGVVPPPIGGSFVFGACPDDRTLNLVAADGTLLAGTALTTAQEDYDKIVDGMGGTDTDDLWYGWKVREPVTEAKITIKINDGADEYGGASLLAAVAASGTMPSSITSLTVTNGEITETDWAWFMGGDTPILTTLTHFTVADAVTSVANIPNGSSESPVFPKTIKNVSIPQAITIGEYAFYYCMALTSASFPAATSIGEYAFSKCMALTSASFPAATGIRNSAFDFCADLTSASFPAATDIGPFAFSKCTTLTSASFPAATSIGQDAFKGCSKLATLTLGAVPPHTVGTDAFLECPKTTLKLVAADDTPLTDNALTTAQADYDAVDDKETGYATDGKWYGWKVREPVAVAKITIKINDATTEYVGATLQAAVTASKVAPADITKLTVTNGEFVATDWAIVTQLEGLTDFAIDAAVTPVANIPNGAENHPVFPQTIKNVSIPQAITIGDYAFYQCAALESASFPKATSIGNEAFSSCWVLTSASFPAATGIGKNAFYDCKALTSTNFPVVTSIGVTAFDNCTFLTSVSFPAATSIGADAFVYCEVLASASFPKVTSIGTSAFYQCTALATLTLPGTAVPTVGGYAFFRCPDDRKLMFVDANGTPLTGTDLTNAQEDYDKVVAPDAGTATDDLWYGWKIGGSITPPADCTCTLDGLGAPIGGYGTDGEIPTTFVTQTVKAKSLPFDIMFIAEGDDINGSCAVDGHKDAKIKYIYEVTSPNPASAVIINGTPQTPTTISFKVLGATTIKCTASANGKTKVFTATFTVEKKATSPAPGGELTAPLDQDKVDAVFGEDNATLDNTTQPPKITIDNSITTEKPIEIETDVTIDLDGNTINGKPCQPPIIVGDGDKVTIGGGGTVSGGDNSGGAGGNGITGGTGSDITIGGGTTVEGGDGATGGDGINSGGNVTVDNGTVTGGNGSSGVGGDGVDTSGGSGDININPDGSATGGNSTGGNGNGGDGTISGGNTTVNVNGDVIGGSGSGSGSGGNGATDTDSGSGTITVQPGGSAQGGNGGTSGGAGGDGIQNNGSGTVNNGGTATGGTGGSNPGGTGGAGGNGTSSDSGAIDNSGTSSGGAGGAGSSTGGNGGNGTSTGSGNTDIDAGGSASGGNGGTGSTGGNGGNGTSSGSGSIEIGAGGSAGGGNGGTGSAGGGNGGNGTSSGGNDTTIDGGTLGGNGGNATVDGNGGNGGNGANQGSGTVVDGSGSAQGGNGGNAAGTGIGGNGGAGVGGGATHDSELDTNLGINGHKAIAEVDDSKAGTTVTVPDKSTLVDAALTPEEKKDGTITEVNVVLNVEKKSDQPDKSKIDAVLKQPSVKADTIGAFFDITLDKTITKANGTQASVKVANASEEIEITITIPIDMRDGSNYVVIRVHDGVAAALDTAQHGVQLTFSTDKFSTYAIAYTKTGATTPPTPPIEPDVPSSDAENEFWASVKDKIENANSGDVVRANAGNYDKMPQSIMDALRENPGVSLVILYGDGKTITIPAGTAKNHDAGRTYYEFSLLAELYKGIEFVETPHVNKKNPQTGTSGYIAYADGSQVPVTGSVTQIEPPATNNTIAYIVLILTMAICTVLLRKRNQRIP